MVTNYATEIEQWEAWQQAYRFGVLLIFPLQPLLAQVNALRSQYDPRSQAICDAHISLTGPLPEPINAAQWSELAAIAAELPAFSIRYGSLMNYLPHPGVCLAIEPQERVDHLRIALERAAIFAGAPPRQYPFSAHMTLAEFISAEQTESLMDELAPVAPKGIFTCTNVAYAVPDETFHFTERKRLALFL